MKPSAAVLLCLFCLPGMARAGVFNLATFSCDNYEIQILNSAASDKSEDAVNFTMWLFGFAVGHAGDHSIYSKGLQSFGNALEVECKSRPSASLLAALGTVNPANESPMDLKELDCTTFKARNADLAKTDAESARTIRMWLFGFSVGKAGGKMFDTDGLDEFDKALTKQCGLHEQSSLFDALSAVRIPKKYR
jgi:HdeA/HdeB family